MNDDDGRMTDAVNFFKIFKIVPIPIQSEICFNPNPTMTLTKLHFRIMMMVLLC